jgi:N6-adenosine-specific RNA methylase IME4
VRVGAASGKLYLDLANESWQAIEIDARGWRILDSNAVPVRFKRAPGMLPLPTPAKGGSIEALRPFLNVSSDADFELAVAWLLAAMRHQGVSVSAAADVATLPKAEQQEIVARGEREILRAAQDIRARKAEIRRAERIERLVEISKGNAPLGIKQQTYPIILADPPWRYEHPTFSLSREIEEHYPTLALEEICALPVTRLASESALLFLWVPPPKLAECFKVIEAWGFEYRTGLVWIKHAIGMGNYVRQQHEHLLIARRGEIPLPEPTNRPSSIIEAPRREHSRKPDEAHELIERMYPELPKIELFARYARPGWDCWGNEIPLRATPDMASMK